MRAPKTGPACGLALAVIALGLWGFGGAAPDDAAALDGERAAIARVAAGKDGLLADLRAGRTTLAAAADAYYAMVVACDRLLAGLRAFDPHAGSDLERASLRLCDHAVRDVHPADRDALAARLAAEHRDRFPRGSPPLAPAHGGQ